MTLETNDQPLNGNGLFYKKFKNLKKIVFEKDVYQRCTISGDDMPWRLHFVPWRLLFVSSQHRT
jgi:hypothetical protein